MKILDRLDELREKATKGPFAAYDGYIHTVDQFGDPKWDEIANAYDEDQSSYIVTACNAEEAMVRVCRAAEGVWDREIEGMPGEDAWPELRKALTALREIEP